MENQKSPENNYSLNSSNSTSTINLNHNYWDYQNYWNNWQPYNQPQPLINITTRTGTGTYINTLLPECFITVNKSRCKLFNEKLYLKNNTEFEFELFNPSNSTYGIKFKINGNYISNNLLVLYPGKRIFLDRYLNDTKKFMYITYDVENTKDVQDAIINNGNIEIEFYKEKVYNDNIVYFTNTNITNSSQLFDSGEFTKCSNNIETGIIGKGNNSDSVFNNVNMNFEYYMTHQILFKILPLSHKPIEPKDLIKICNKCNTKAKKNHQYCSKCGNKL